MKRVNFEEYKEFIKEYPRQLERRVSHVCEPPMESWNDSTLGSWPEGVVASCSIMPNNRYYTDVYKDCVSNGDYLESDWSIIE